MMWFQEAASVSSGIVAIVIAAGLSLLNSALLALGLFIVRDIRDRLTRLENIALGRGPGGGNSSAARRWAQSAGD